MRYLLSIDQGTTSSRALLFTETGERVNTVQQEFPQYFPYNGWVEHNLEEIWQTTLKVTKEAIQQSHVAPQDILAIGISNQRETTCIWHKKTGIPVYNAIVWQDRRTSDICQALKNEGIEPIVAQKTGLLLDPYFSATKIAWVLDKIPGVREAAEKGECLFGTIDTFLLWRLTGGAVHATDATNASRTALFNIHTQTWDEELLTLFKIPRAMLPEVKDSADTFGITNAAVLGHAIPICALIGDQQAATIGQACIQPGMVKSTYGTGCFLVVNTGDTPITSTHQLLSTTAYRLKGKTTYALEGSIFIAGAAVQWLRDGLKIIPTAADTERLAMSIPSSGGVVVVPAFTGLGAPYWNAKARGAIFGITRDTTTAHIVRATLEAVCFSTRDLLEAVYKDTAQPLQTLRVDGGMVTNNWFTQTLADILHMPIARPTVYETTALGAAFLAGLGCGLFKQLSDITQFWKPEKQFEPHMGDIERQQLYHHWIQAIGKVQA